MSEDGLRWTVLRHRMLREVVADSPRREIWYWPPTRWDPDLFTNRRYDLSGPERTTLRALLRFGNIQQGIRTNDAGAYRAELTETGRALLSRWDAEHPEVEP